MGSPENAQLAGIGVVDIHDHADRCGFTAAVGTDKTKHRTLRDGKRKIVHRSDLSEGLSDVGQLDGGHWEAYSNGWWSRREPDPQSGTFWSLSSEQERPTPCLVICRARDALAYWFAEGHEVWVAEAGGEILGTYFLRANQRGGGAHVANCGYMTARGSEGRGIARAMCTHSMDQARERGFRAMQFNFVVSTNERAVRVVAKPGIRNRRPLAGCFSAIPRRARWTLWSCSGSSETLGGPLPQSCESSKRRPEAHDTRRCTRDGSFLSRAGQRAPALENGRPRHPRGRLHLGR